MRALLRVFYNRNNLFKWIVVFSVLIFCKELFSLSISSYQQLTSIIHFQKYILSLYNYITMRIAYGIHL